MTFTTLINNWPQWLIISSFVMRLILVTTGLVAGQTYVKVPLYIVVIYTVFLSWCLYCGHFFEVMR